MARSRNIKPGFFTNEELVELDFATRLLFIGLWTLADREGRLEDKPKKIKMSLFPADNIDIDSCLNGLKNRNFIHRYSVDGIQYIQVLAFKKHQNPHIKEPASSIPAPVLHQTSTVQATLIPDSLLLIPEKTIVPASPSRFHEFWEIWPRTDRKSDKAKCLQKWNSKKLDSKADEILAHVTAMKETSKWKDGFEPAPYRYLHGEMWNDEVINTDRSKEQKSQSAHIGMDDATLINMARVAKVSTVGLTKSQMVSKINAKLGVI